MVSGEFFEAKTSQGHPATLKGQDGSLMLLTNGSSLKFDAGTVDVSQRLAHLPRCINFPGGSMFTTFENEQVDNILRSIGRSPKGSWISFFESGWRWTLLALFVLPVVLYLLFSIGMPLVAKPLASMVPDTVKSDLDRKVMGFLDKRVLVPSSLSLDRQTELMEEISRISKFTPDTRLLFRGGGLVGANAFALPGGTIVFTDEIVEMADNDGELVAVYMHEIGHVVGNHALRNIIQMTGVSFIMGWMLGDLTMITDIALVGAPVFLQRMVYSRKVELEADAYAMNMMPITGYSKNCFADMMEKLSTQGGRDKADYPNYLSSHPSPRQRIAMARSDQPCSEHQKLGRKATAAKSTTSKQMVEGLPPGEILRTYRDHFPIKKVPPAYPKLALIQNIEGYCVVQYTVTSLGTVKDPVVLEDQCTHPLFEQPSIEAALKFTYVPKMINSRTVDAPGVENKFTYKIMPNPQND